MKRRFTGYLMTKEGVEMDRKGLDTNDDKYGIFKPVLIETDEIEVVMPLEMPVLGSKVTKLFLRSGNTMTVKESLEECEQLIYKGTVLFN